MRHAILPAATALALTLACTGAGPAPGEAGGAVAPAAPPPPLRCQGNEPFWNLHLTAADAVYRTLEGGEPGRRFVGGYATPAGDGALEWRGTAGDDPAVELSASIREERCLDTMSDETPPFSHAVLLRPPGGGERRGCCRPGDSAALEGGTVARVTEASPARDGSCSPPRRSTRPPASAGSTSACSTPRGRSSAGSRTTRAERDQRSTSEKVS